MIRWFLMGALIPLMAIAALLMPGWWWAMMGAYLLLMLALGVAKGMGKPWAHRLSRVLFWPRG